VRKCFLNFRRQGISKQAAAVFIFTGVSKAHARRAPDAPFLAEEDIPMKKTFASLLLIVLLMAASALPALAGGGQVRGENGLGSVTQVQVMNPPPFQP
jgi:hypothetical protein